MTRLARLSCFYLYVDGWRDVVVLSHGRKWLRGFTAATLEPVRLSAEEIKLITDHLGVPPQPLLYSRYRLAQRLRRNAKLYPHSKAVARAIAELGRKAP